MILLEAAYMAYGEPDVLCVPAAQRDRLPMVQAVGRLLWHFMHGEAMTTRQAMGLTGYSKTGVYYLLTELSTYWPICQDDANLWHLEGPFADC